MAYAEEDYLQISGIQHFAFCRRQWALIHIEGQWAENARTVGGTIFHERAHDAGLSLTQCEAEANMDFRGASHRRMRLPVAFSVEIVG